MERGGFRESKGGNTDFEGISGLKRDFCAPKINLLKKILEGFESKGNGAKKHDEQVQRIFIQNDQAKCLSIPLKISTTSIQEILLRLWPLHFHTIYFRLTSASKRIDNPFSLPN